MENREKKLRLKGCVKVNLYVPVDMAEVGNLSLSSHPRNSSFVQASKNVDVLKDHEAVKQLGSILKTNVRACKALGN
jgi:hypothetical protein